MKTGLSDIQIYIPSPKMSLESAFLDHCKRSRQLPEEALRDTDIFILHAPFRNMPETSMLPLLDKYMGLDKKSARAYLTGKGFYDGLDPVAEIGNLYSGAIYLSLAYALKGQHERYGDGIIGKNILLASYGSGNTMLVIRGTVSSHAPSVISKWNLSSVLNNTKVASFEEYERWTRRPYFALKSIREDGYREYSVCDRRDDKQKGETSVHMFRSA